MNVHAGNDPDLDEATSYLLIRNPEQKRSHAFSMVSSLAGRLLHTALYGAATVACMVLEYRERKSVTSAAPAQDSDWKAPTTASDSAILETLWPPTSALRSGSSPASGKLNAGLHAPAHETTRERRPFRPTSPA